MSTENTTQIIKSISVTHTMPADLHEQLIKLSNATGLGFSKLITILLSESPHLNKTEHRATLHYYDIDLENIINNKQTTI
jgi:hypothetical protein